MQNETITQIHKSLVSMADGFNDAIGLLSCDSEFRHAPISEDHTGALLESFMRVDQSNHPLFLEAVSCLANDLTEPADKFDVGEKCCQVSEDDIDAAGISFEGDAITIPGVAVIPFEKITPVAQAGFYITTVIANPAFTTEEKNKIIYAIGEFIHSRYRMQ